MEKLLLASTQIGDDDLDALGNRRSQAAKQWLLTNGQVPEERLFLLATKVGKSSEGAEAAAAPASGAGAKTSRVEFSLK
jgi:outer membrane protein OmpA-like peptidoglycan-associated protein